MQLLGVVDEEARLLLIALQKMLGGNLQRLGHAFADGNAGYDDDELAPAVLLVQLEDGFDVAVGLARAGLHLDVEIDLGYLRLDQRVRQRQVLCLLYSVDVVDQCLLRQGEVRVAKSRFVVCRHL